MQLSVLLAVNLLSLLQGITGSGKTEVYLTDHPRSLGQGQDSHFAGT